MYLSELFTKKYNEWMGFIRPVDLERIQSEQKNPVEYMYLCLEITHKEIVSNGGYNSPLYEEIRVWHEMKWLASNKHRNANNQVTKYWLTKKGFKQLNRNHAIC